MTMLSWAGGFYEENCIHWCGRILFLCPGHAEHTPSGSTNTNTDHPNKPKPRLFRLSHPGAAMEPKMWERPRNVETFWSLLLPTFLQAWCASQWAASKNAPRPAPPWDQQRLRPQEPLQKLLPGWGPWTRLLPSLGTSVNDSNQVRKAYNNQGKWNHP